MKQNKHTIRIIAGEHRTRLLEVVDREGLRPTGNRMRETLFNWLQPMLPGAHCLDLFAGSGALGLEALSRGAASVTFIEKDREAYQVLRRNVDSICKDTTKYQLVNGNALQHLQKANEQSFSMIFIDPPFGMPELLQNVIELLNSENISQSVKCIAVERSLQEKPIILNGFQVYREMKTKESNLTLFIRI